MGGWAGRRPFAVRTERPSVLFAPLRSPTSSDIFSNFQYLFNLSWLESDSPSQNDAEVSGRGLLPCLVHMLKDLYHRMGGFPQFPVWCNNHVIQTYTRKFQGADIRKC